MAGSRPIYLEPSLANPFLVFFTISCWEKSETLSSGYNLPRFWEVSYSARDATNYTDLVPTNLRSCWLGPCMTIKWQQPDFRQNKKYIEIYVTWLYLVFMYILPFLLLTVLNGLIYAEVSFLVGCDTISYHLHLWWLRMCRWDEQEMWGQSSLGVRQINKTIFPHWKT